MALDHTRHKQVHLNQHPAPHTPPDLRNLSQYPFACPGGETAFPTYSRAAAIILLASKLAYLFYSRDALKSAIVESVIKLTNTVLGEPL